MYQIEEKHPELGWISWTGVTDVVGDIWGGIEKVGGTAWKIAKETLPVIGPSLISYKLGQYRTDAEREVAEEQIAAQKELALLQLQPAQTPGRTTASFFTDIPSPTGLTTKDLLLYGGIAFGSLALLMIFLRRPKKEV